VEPVRVKVYGLVSMTRRGYLTQLAIAAMLVFVLLVFRWLRWPEVRPDPAKVRDQRVLYVIVFFDNVQWIVAVVAALLVFEAWLVLRRFAQKEAERASQPPAKPG
jgi:hypothetical protein